MTTVAAPVLDDKGKPLIHQWSDEGARFFICKHCNHVVQDVTLGSKKPRWLHWGSAREECA
jgi:hypothetical protein